MQHNMSECDIATAIIWVVGYLSKLIELNMPPAVRPPRRIRKGKRPRALDSRRDRQTATGTSKAADGAGAETTKDAAATAHRRSA